jgi:broad specificity phosphatase PhoE
MASIWLIRHGQAGPDIMGDYDRLSELGWAQSRHAGERWRHLGEVHHAVHGAMRRHRETLEGFREGFGDLPSPEEDPRWDEFDHVTVIKAAIAAGMNPRTLEDFFTLAMGRWASGDHDGDYPEPYHIFQARVVDGLERLGRALGSGQTALVFTSGGAIAAACRHLLEAPPVGAFRINRVLVNAGFTRVWVGGGRATLASMNVHTHFDDAPDLLTRR